jgi:asparagine synthase (glutamine-hydrolysing)
MLRLFCLRWRPGDARLEQECRERWRRLEAGAAWSKVIDRRGVLLCLAAPDRDLSPLVLENEEGVIAGALFTRGCDGRPSRHVTRLGAEQVREMLDTGGRGLIEGYWGSYVAILHDRRGDLLHVLRDPVASRPIYFGPLPGGAICVFTHAGDFISATGEVACDDGFISAYLLRSRLVSQRTAIAGVTEVLPGQRLTIGRDGMNCETLWRPAPVRQRGRRPSFSEARAMLRSAVLDAARAWASVAPRIVHRLSGGLDSSIVLAALAASGAPAPVCLHERPKGFHEGDEREYAALAADRFNARLIEVEGDPERVDYAQLARIEPTAKPSDAQLSFSSRRLLDAAMSEGALIVTSGQGGDQVLHRSRTPLIAADAFRDGVAFKDQLRIALDTARLARRPVWDVFAAMAKHGFARAPADPLRRLEGRMSFASADALAIVRAESERHYWADEMRGASPARAMRIGHIIDLQYYHQYSQMNAHFAAAPILAMRPVVEACLSIPPYVMVEGGGERALARAAFADLLPGEILDRKQKGATTRYHQAALERQVPLMKDVLIGGELAKRGLVRSDAVEAALKQATIADAASAANLRTAFVAEMWLRRFLAARTEALDRIRSLQRASTVEST